MMTTLFTALLFTGEANAQTVVQFGAPAVSVDFNTGGIHWDINLGRYVWAPAPPPVRVVEPVRVAGPVQAHVMAPPHRVVWIPAHYVGVGHYRRYVPGHYE